MRRIIVNGLAVIGAFATLSVLAAKLTGPTVTGVVEGPDHRRATNIPVFLDRRTGVIERFLTDSNGRFRLPLERAELSQAVWLICVPGGIPMVGSRSQGQLGPTTYGTTALPVGQRAPVRGFGWTGPIPRECAADSVTFWRFPPEANKPPMAVSVTEPDWTSYRAP
jgi:hypothetical protein